MDVDPETTQWSLAAIIGLAGLLLGWVVRSLGFASNWGELKQKVVANERDLLEFKATFEAHLTADRDRQSRLDVKLDGIARDVNQLIGQVKVMSEPRTGP